MARRTSQMYVRSAANEQRLRSIREQRKTSPHNPSKRPVTLPTINYPPELVESEQDEEETTNDRSTPTPADR